MEDDKKELNNFFLKMLHRQEAIFVEFDKEVEEGLEKLDDILFPKTPDIQLNNKTPQQIKKRTKRLTTVVDTDTEDNSIYSKTCSENHSKIEEITFDRTSKRLPRAAKSNLILKEPPLNKKCRRPSNFNEKCKSNIKLEPGLDTTNKNTKKKSTKLDKNHEYSKNSILSEQITDEKMEIDEIPHKLNNNNVTENLQEQSIVIVTAFKNAIIDIPDSETENEMPPPQIKPSKKNLRNKNNFKYSEEDKSKTNVLSDETSNDIAENFSKQPVVKIEKLSLEKINSLSDISKQTEKPTKAKGKKGRKGVPKPIKEERISSDSKNNSNINKIKNENASIVAAAVPQSEKNISLESVYEDAIPPNDNVQTQPNEILTDQSKSTTKILTKSITNNINELENMKTSENDNENNDKTFVSTKELAPKIAASMANETFVTQSNLITAQSTFIVTDQNIINATINMNETNVEIFNSDMTFNVPLPPPENVDKNIEKNAVIVPINRDSIMTEDDSDFEIPIIKYKPKPKSQLLKKELFNPCVQSPLKKKIEAFEKQAFNYNSPIPVRQTRTKTRAKQAKENTEPDKGKPEENTESNKVSQIQQKPLREKIITPLIGRQIGRLLTPSQSSTITPTIGVFNKLPSTTSKIIGIQKSLQSVPSSLSSNSRSRTPSQSRENSVEDLRRYGTKLQELTEERKKKRELKQQQAQQVRERKEKERADNLKKMMEEREEKARRKAAEAEQKRQIDEINRQLKLQEEKREQQRKLEKQKQLEREAAAETARKEREILENIKIQKAKEKMQKLKLEQDKKQLLLKKINNNSGPKYDFDMINSDDSTDDETADKANRPPIPLWSKSSVRQIAFEKQANVPTKIIDKFFSVQPLTPDLLHIFPTIDLKYLKRNSSVIWKTPPRYSQLPKKN